MLGGGFVAKASLRIRCGNPGSGLMFLQGRINDQHVSMLVDTGASHSFMSPQMVKSLGFFSMRSRQPHRGEVCEGRTSSGGGEWWGMCPSSAGRGKGKKVLPSARWTTSMSSWA